LKQNTIKPDCLNKNSDLSVREATIIGEIPNLSIILDLEKAVGNAIAKPEGTRIPVEYVIYEKYFYKYF